VKGVRVTLQTDKGDRRTDGFPGPAHSCALGISEEHPIEINAKVSNSKFAGKKGTLLLSKSAPVSFERLYPFHGAVKYTGTATYELKIDWRRTRKGPRAQPRNDVRRLRLHAR
jgi:hypothetical protein